MAGIDAGAVIFWSDQDHAEIVLRDDAAIRVMLLKGVKVQTGESTRYDSCGNGLAEAGVKAVRDKVHMLTSWWVDAVTLCPRP